VFQHAHRNELLDYKINLHPLISMVISNECRLCPSNDMLHKYDKNQTFRDVCTRVYPKVSGLSRNEINNNNKHSLRSNIKDYGGKTHWTNSSNSDTIAPSGRELYHLQFSLQAASPETLGYTLL
jgi:hypothetical protein